MMKQLPLAPPRCKRFLAALATLLAAGPSEATTVAKMEVQTCVLAEPGIGQQILAYLGYLVIVLVTYLAVRGYDRVSGAFTSIAAGSPSTMMSSPCKVAIESKHLQ